MTPMWWTRRTGRPAPPARPRLGAERLEDRRAPAVALWDGRGADDAWTTAANWNVGGADRVPSFGDDIIFDGTSDKPARVDQPAVLVHSLTLNPGYNGTLTVAPGTSLVVETGLAVNAGTL